jgi:hypothetical protein
VCVWSEFSQIIKFCSVMLNLMKNEKFSKIKSESHYIRNFKNVDKFLFLFETQFKQINFGKKNYSSVLPFYGY